MVINPCWTDEKPRFKRGFLLPVISYNNLDALSGDGALNYQEIMSMSKIEFSIAESGRIKTFLSKLADSFDKLPESLQLELLSILNCEQFEYDSEWFNSKFPNAEFKAYVGGEPLDVKVTSMNPHLKLVKYHVLNDQKEPLTKDGDFVIGELKVNSFRAYADNKLIMRW